jgi:hypothetical protein
MKRMAPARRVKLYEAAQRLAESRATIFRVQRRTGKGEPLTGFKTIPVTGERHRNNLLAKGARPALTSSQWRVIYEEVGLA